MKLMLALVTPQKWNGKLIPANHSPFLIGRQAGCHLRSGSATLEDRHCALLTREGRVFVRHVAAAGQTLLNGQPVHGEREVRDGDRVSIGCLTFTIILQAETSPPRSKQPVAAADKEDEVGNLLLQMDAQERAGCDLAPYAEGAARSGHRFAFADNAYPPQPPPVRPELPDPATAAGLLLAKFDRPFGLRIGKRR